MGQAVLLLSGGLDSGSLLYWAIVQDFVVLPLYVDYGQVTQPGEWQAVCRLLESLNLQPIEPLSVQDVAALGSGTLIGSSAALQNASEYFPSRNLLLIALAAMSGHKQRAEHILIGLVADAAASFPDCSSEFLQCANVLLQLEHPQVTLQAPFISRSKVEIVQEAMGYGFRPELTFSCNRLPDHHCWQCSSCLDRFRVFRQLGLT